MPSDISGPPEISNHPWKLIFCLEEVSFWDLLGQMYIVSGSVDQWWTKRRLLVIWLFLLFWQMIWWSTPLSVDWMWMLNRDIFLQHQQILLTIELPPKWTFGWLIPSYPPYPSVRCLCSPLNQSRISFGTWDLDGDFFFSEILSSKQYVCFDGSVVFFFVKIHHHWFWCYVVPIFWANQFFCCKLWCP